MNKHSNRIMVIFFLFLFFPLEKELVSKADEMTCKKLDKDLNKISRLKHKKQKVYNRFCLAKTAISFGLTEYVHITNYT